jgi:hypothetical protein
VCYGLVRLDGVECLTRALVSMPLGREFDAVFHVCFVFMYFRF